MMSLLTSTTTGTIYNALIDVGLLSPKLEMDVWSILISRDHSCIQIHDQTTSSLAIIGSR